MYIDTHWQIHYKYAKGLDNGLNNINIGVQVCNIVISIFTTIRQRFNNVTNAMTEINARVTGFTITYMGQKISITFDEYCHLSISTGHVKCVERALFEQDLLNIKQTSFRDKCVIETSSFIIKRGNYDNIKSVDTIRKI